MMLNDKDGSELNAEQSAEMVAKTFLLRTM